MQSGHRSIRPRRPPWEVVNWKSKYSIALSTVLIVDLLERSWIESYLIPQYVTNTKGRPPWEVVNWKIVWWCWGGREKRSTSLRGRELKDKFGQRFCKRIESTSLRGRELKASCRAVSTVLISVDLLERSWIERLCVAKLTLIRFVDLLERSWIERE